MHYFTPDLLERFASEDDQIALPAHGELEQRAQQYHEHLTGIAKNLPPRFREMQDRFYLHDARVLGVALPSLIPGGALSLVGQLRSLLSPCPPEADSDAALPQSILLALRLDQPPQEILILHYRQARVDAVGCYPPLEENLPFLEWRHDEIALAHSPEHLEFRHSILFTNGIEITLRFRDFDYATLAPLASDEGGKQPTV